MDDMADKSESVHSDLEIAKTDIINPSIEKELDWMRQHYCTEKKMALTCRACGQQIALGWLEKHLEVCPFRARSDP